MSDFLPPETIETPRNDLKLNPSAAWSTDYSQDIERLRDRQKSQTMLWLTAVIFLVLVIIGIAVWHTIEIRDARNQERRDVAALRQQMDDMQAKWLSKQEESNDKLLKRYDTLEAHLMSFASDLSWARGKLEAFQETIGANIQTLPGK